MCDYYSCVSYCLIAACLEVLGRLDEAWPLYEESLNLRKVRSRINMQAIINQDHKLFEGSDRIRDIQLVSIIGLTYKLNQLDDPEAFNCILLKIHVFPSVPAYCHFS